MCVFFLLSSQLRLSFVSVVFDFSASLNDVAPVSPILFPDDVMKMKKSGLLMDFIHVWACFFTAQVKFSECCV